MEVCGNVASKQIKCHIRSGKNTQEIDRGREGRGGGQMVLPVMDGGEEVGGGGEAAGCHVQSAAATGAHGNKMEITAGSSCSGKKLITSLQCRDRRKKTAPAVFPQSADLKINVIIVIIGWIIGCLCFQ